MPIESRKGWANGVLFGYAGSLSTALAADEPPMACHFFCTSGLANHLMYCSAASRLAE